MRLPPLAALFFVVYWLRAPLAPAAGRPLLLVSLAGKRRGFSRRMDGAWIDKILR
jgi:hypothetical protein